MRRCANTEPVAKTVTNAGTIHNNEAKAIYTHTPTAKEI